MRINAQKNKQRNYPNYLAYQLNSRYYSAILLSGLLEKIPRPYFAKAVLQAS